MNRADTPCRTVAPPPAVRRSAVGAARPMPAWAYRLAGLGGSLRLSWAPLLVFGVGMATVVGTWLLFSAYHPDYLARTLPSISRTASSPPGDALFTAGMTFVSACTVVSWLQIYLLNTHRVRVLGAGGPGDRDLRILNALGCGLGIAAGVFLALLANVTLDDDGEVHEVFSIVFFATQVAAFIADTLFTARLRRRAGGRGIDPAALFIVDRLELKSWLCYAVAADALLFLCLFLEREVEWVADRRLMLELYTASEFSVAILCFVYAAAYFRPLAAFVAACRAAAPGGGPAGVTAPCSGSPASGHGDAGA